MTDGREYVQDQPEPLRKAADAVMEAAREGFDLVEILQLLNDDIACPDRIVPEVCDALDCLLEG